MVRAHRTRLQGPLRLSSVAVPTPDLPESRDLEVGDGRGFSCLVKARLLVTATLVRKHCRQAGGLATGDGQRIADAPQADRGGLERWNAGNQTMKIVISALHFEWRDIPDCIRRTRDEFGIDGVELSFDSSFTRANCTREDLAVLAKLPGHGDIQLGAHLWLDIASSDAEASRKELINWLDLAGRTGVKNVVIHGGRADDRAGGIARARSVLESVLGAYEKAGVVINIENHYPYEYKNCHELFSEPWEFMELFSLDSPCLKVCFDTGHGNMTRNSEELIGRLAPWLNYVHLADNHGVDDDHLMFRRGTVDWDGVFASLRRVGFDGLFCVEFPVRDDLAPFRECLHEIRRLWQGPET